MREISLHLMDIIQNSIAAGAQLITIEIIENISEDFLEIIVKDDGCGISQDMIDKVTDPFITSRKSRRVGLGLSLFEAACKRCNGNFEIISNENQGTEVKALMQYSHIDRAPLGKIQDTIVSTLLTCNIDVLYKHSVDNRLFIFDSREIKEIIGSSLEDPKILQWIKEYLKENIDEIGGGVW